CTAMAAGWSSRMARSRSSATADPIPACPPWSPTTSAPRPRSSCFATTTADRGPLRSTSRRPSAWPTRARERPGRRLGPLPAEVRFLDHATGSLERSPHADLPAPVELPGPHHSAVCAVPLPGAVHLAVKVEALHLEHAGAVALDVRNGFGWRGHAREYRTAMRSTSQPE